MSTYCNNLTNVLHSQGILLVISTKILLSLSSMEFLSSHQPY